jgi:hypothetical protein
MAAGDFDPGVATAAAAARIRGPGLDGPDGGDATGLRIPLPLLPSRTVAVAEAVAPMGDADVWRLVRAGTVVVDAATTAPPLSQLQDAAARAASQSNNTAR